MNNNKIIQTIKEKDLVSFSEEMEKILFQKVSERLPILEESINHEILEAVARRIIRVNFRGQRTKRKKCPKGFYLDGNTCVPMSSNQKAEKKRSIRKAIKTKRADASGRKIAIRKRKLALKKRKSQGL